MNYTGYRFWIGATTAALGGRLDIMCVYVNTLTAIATSFIYKSRTCRIVGFYKTCLRFLHVTLGFRIVLIKRYGVWLEV